MNQPYVTFVECYGRCGHKMDQDPTRPPMDGYWCPECKPKFERYLGPDPDFEPNRDDWYFDQKGSIMEEMFVRKLRKGFNLIASRGDRESDGKHHNRD